MFRSWKFWIVAIPLAVIIVIASYAFTHSGRGVDVNNPPQFIQADFIDLSKIYSISKFRSGEGHDFSGNGETCRSMKHYFTPQYDPAAVWREVNGEQLPPLPDGKTDIPIYSPVDGRITGVSEEHTPIGKQISIRPSSATQFNVRLFHVYPLDGVGVGSKVTAGQQIGVIGANQGTDIAIQVGGMPWNETYVSYFQVMPDSVFASYQARSVTSRNDFILSKEYRDANPLQCNGEQFVYPESYDRSQDDVHLSGYIDQSGSTGSASEQGSLTIDLSLEDDGKVIELSKGQGLLLTAEGKRWAVDLGDYNKTVLNNVGSEEQYQFERKLQAIKAGTTHVIVTLTMDCAIPKENQARCLVASKQLTLQVTVK